MLKVGLTGNVASGKSTVARIWRSLGAPIIDADELARRAVEPGSPALAEIVHRWGPQVLGPSGDLDRTVLRRIVFTDPAEREQLESIIHPAVAALRDEAYRLHASRGEPVVVADIPLLFEAGLQDQFDVIVLVDAPETVRLERMVRDRGMDPEEARSVIRAQMPAELKRARADRVIENTGTLPELGNRAIMVWRELRALAGVPAEPA